MATTTKLVIVDAVQHVNVRSQSTMRTLRAATVMAAVRIGMPTMHASYVRRVDVRYSVVDIILSMIRVDDYNVNDVERRAPISSSIMRISTNVYCQSSTILIIIDNNNNNDDDVVIIDAAMCVRHPSLSADKKQSPPPPSTSAELTNNNNRECSTCSSSSDSDADDDAFLSNYLAMSLPRLNSPLIMKFDRIGSPMHHRSMRTSPPTINDSSRRRAQSCQTVSYHKTMYFVILFSLIYCSITYFAKMCFRVSWAELI